MRFVSWDEVLSSCLFCLASASVRSVLLCSLVPFFSILSRSWIWFGLWLALVVDVDVDVGGVLEGMERWAGTSCATYAAYAYPPLRSVPPSFDSR